MLSTAVGCHICAAVIHSDCLSAFVAYLLIYATWCLAYQYWSIAKAVLHLVDTNICEACGVLQVCAGCEDGCEATIHAVCQLFHDPGSQAVLSVDALNAFNSVNRQAAL